MKYPYFPLTIVCTVVLFALAATPLLAREAPREVGGFVLGSKVSEYPEAMSTNFLKEMVVTDWYGFRKGVISYGICKYPDQIVRIELKYEDQSKAYFKKLLKDFKQRFGAPDEWKGDSFGILHIWKWYFTDNDGHKVSLLLQHNLRNPNESIGNVVKLTNSDMINEERRCFNDMCEAEMDKVDKARLEERKIPKLEYLIPQ